MKNDLVSKIKKFTDFKTKIDTVDDQIKKLENYYSRLKDLAVHKEGLTRKMDEYAALVIENAKIRKKIVQAGQKIETEKNKMVAAENLSNIEDGLKDIERDFERSKKEVEKKWEQLVQERAKSMECGWHLKIPLIILNRALSNL